MLNNIGLQGLMSGEQQMFVIVVRGVTYILL